MKKIMLVAACATAFFCIDAHAGWLDFFRPSPTETAIFKSTNTANVTAGQVSNSAYLHKVIVSSPSATSETGGVLSIYNSQGTATNKVVDVQLSTASATGVREWVFDLYLGNGLTITNNTALSSAQIIYENGIKNDYQVWQSSFGVVNVSTQVLSLGPVLLHKILVLKAGAGTTNLRVYNSSSSTVSAGDRLAQIDLTIAKSYDFDVMFPKGLVINVDSAGSSSAEVMYIFKKNPSRDWEYWNAAFSGTAESDEAIFAGRGIFGGVINGDVSTDGNIKIYDANGAANDQIAEIDSDTQFGQDYNIHVSSGLTYTTVGAGMWTIRYRR